MDFSQKKLQLLRDITGAFRPRILTALMGVSGAGKTTLMDVLSRRQTGGTVEGDIRIGGYPEVQKTFARISGYCEQNVPGEYPVAKPCWGQRGPWPPQIFYKNISKYICKS